MALKLIFLAFSHLLIFTSANDPFWNLLNHAIEVSDGYGDINATKDAEGLNSNSLRWNLGIEIGQGQMIRLKFLLQGNYDMLTLDVDGTEKFVATGVSCYYFTRSGQTDSKCELTATQSGCEFVNLTTTHLNLFYSGVDRPHFIFEYVYMDCSGNSLFSTTTTTPTTSTTTPPFNPTILTTATTGTSVTGSSTTTTPTTTTTSTTTTASASEQTTSDANSTVQKIDDRAKNSPTSDAQNSGVTAQTTSATSTAKSNGPAAGIDNNIIIAVVVVAILFILIVILLLVCGKRFRRYQKQLKELHSGKFSNISNSGAPPIDPLYEEIAPQLPLRNMNMKEPGYEVPLCSMGPTQTGNSQGQSSQTVENELYLKRSEDKMPPTSQSNGTKYGSVENELYHEDESSDDEINANVVTEDTKCVALTNELYAASDVDASANHTPPTVDVINERPQTPLVQATANSELEVNDHDSSTVSNVLYNM